MKNLTFLVPILLGTLIWNSSAESISERRSKIEWILAQYEPYILSINTRASRFTTEHGWNSSICTGFLLEWTKSKVVTAFHCLPTALEIMSSLTIVDWKVQTWVTKIPHIISTEWYATNVVCTDVNSDLAILAIDWVPNGKIAPRIPEWEVPIGTPYTSVLSNQESWFSYWIDWIGRISFPTRLYSQWTIIAKSYGSIEYRDTWSIEKTWIELLQTDNSPKWWFSGWPLMTEEGFVIGIWTLLDWSFGGASSIENLKRLLLDNNCRNKLYE